MKRFLKKLVLLFIPILLYFGLFVALEPLNYFGLFAEAEIPSTEPLGKMRQVMRKDLTGVIIGDSRTAHINEEYLSQVTGIDYYNLGFSGASLKEEIDLFWWAAEHNENLKYVMLQTGFWTVSEAYALDRIEPLVPVAEDPTEYLFSAEYHKKMITNLPKKLHPEKPVVKHYTDEERAENLIYYATKVIYPRAEEYQTDWSDIEELKKVAAYCEDNGIRLVILFPPVERSIWELVIEPLGIYDAMTEAKREISRFATVYDMEYPEMDAYSAKDYNDGFHLSGMVNGLDYADPDFPTEYAAFVDYVDQMYNGKTDHMHIWKDGEIVAGPESPTPRQ